MKKFLCLLMLLTLLTSAFAFSGCALANTGDSDEVAGIYGIESYVYRNATGENISYGDRYDYLLIVLYEGDTAKVIYKPTADDNGEKEEVSLDTTYTMTFGDTEKPEKVTSVQLASFPLGALGVSTGATGSDPVTFTFFPIREDLVLNKRSLTKNGQGSLVNVGPRFEFNKISSKTTDKKLDKAKQRQTDTRENRSDTTTTDEE